MALFPIISNFERDFVLLLVPVDTENTMDEVAAAAAHHSVGRQSRAAAGQGDPRAPPGREANSSLATSA